MSKVRWVETEDDAFEFEMPGGATDPIVLQENLRVLVQHAADRGLLPGFSEQTHVRLDLDLFDPEAFGR